jgi:hypothetical protein
MGSLKDAWSQSKLFRILLIVALLWTILRLGLHTFILFEWLDLEPGQIPIVGADLKIFINAARHFQHRQGLYLQGSLEVLEEHYVYAPPFAMAFVPFLWLPSEFAIALVHTLLRLAAYAVLYIWWSRIFCRLGLDQANKLLTWTLPLWLVYAAFWGDLSYLNIYLAVALLATLLIDAILHERLGWSLLWLSIILQIKPHWAFAVGVPLLLGRYRFFFKLLALAALTYVAVVGVTMLIAGPTHVWEQYGSYVEFLARLSRDFPWRGPDKGYLGYNHSIKQIVVYVLGVTPNTLRLGTIVKMVMLIPLAIVSLRLLLQPARRAGRDVPLLGLDIAFALYLGAFIWLDMVWEVSLGMPVFVYLLATTRHRAARIATWLVFLPYALVDLFQVGGFAILGMDAMDGAYVLTDPSIYVPIIMIVILLFYAILVGRLWNVPAYHRLPEMQRAPE